MLELLKSKLEEAAFMLVDDASRKDVHSKLVECLVILEQANTEGEITPNQIALSDSEEINKVARRLKMWAKSERQNQYNAKILNAYLTLAREGRQNITENDLYGATGEESWFWPNFNQMKTIADRNHGKVFDVDGQFVNIWPSVMPSVKAYEEKVFLE